MTHINQTAFGLALGILWALCMLLLAFTSKFWGYGTEWVNLMGSVYLGAGTGTWLAVILAGVWGFFDGFIGGWLLAWLYNRFS